MYPWALRPYLEIITRQGNLSREFSKNTLEGLHTCVFPSIHTSHPSLICDSLLPRTSSLSDGLQQPFVPPFMGWGGVILESVICCTVCGKIKVAQGFGPNLLLILNDSKVGKGRGERNWIHVRKHHSKTREPVPKTVLKSHSGFCPALFSQFCRVGTEQLMVERCRGYNKKSVIAQSSETLPHLSRYL